MAKNYYQVTEWKKNLYRIYCPAGVFMDLFVGSKSALLFDTGYGFGDLKGTVKEITELPLYIVNSHGHVDHACGNWQFEEPIYIHPADISVCREHNGTYRKKLAVQCARECLNPESGAIENVLPDDFCEDLYLSRGTGNLVPVEEGHVFDLGGMHLRVVCVPGHTIGSIGLILEEEKIFYSGDSMNFSTWLFLPEATPLSVYADSIRKMQKERFEWIMFSHAEERYAKGVLDDFLELAEHVEYDSGYPFSAPLVPGANARCCVKKGYKPEDMLKKDGFASIVISEDKL